MSKLKNMNFYKDNIYLPMFPEPINSDISTKEFLMASKEVVKILDYFGKNFMPIKYNLQGNIDEVSKIFNINKKYYSTLRKIILEKKNNVETGTAIDALLWLRRGLHMVQLFFECIVHDFESGKDSEDLVACFKKSYELTLEPYHGYIAQQLYGLLSHMVPSRSQILQSITNGYDEKQDIVINIMERFSERLKQNISVLKTLYEEHNLENNLV